MNPFDEILDVSQESVSGGWQDHSSDGWAQWGAMAATPFTPPKGFDSGASAGPTTSSTTAAISGDIPISRIVFYEQMDKGFMQVPVAGISPSAEGKSDEGWTVMRVGL